MKSLKALSVVMVLAMTAGLTGCFATSRLVLKTQAPESYRTETVEEVEKDVADRDAAIKTLNASVLITATTGGSKEGLVKEYTSFKGYIFVQQPGHLRVILQVPVFGSRALDMVSDGNTFTLMRATASKGDVWVQGTNEVTKPSKNGLENLRPPVFLDSLLVPGVKPGEFVTLTESTRVLKPEPKHKYAIEEPVYEMDVLRQKSATVLQVERVVRISRVTGLPYQQDVYDDSGGVVTQAKYEGYQTFNGQQFPTVITIRRPKDEYSLKINITKLTLNETFPADQFELKIPAGVVVTKME
jgi:outer membrane lipoprotein-sorting protein